MTRCRESWATEQQHPRPPPMVKRARERFGQPHSHATGARGRSRTFESCNSGVRRGRPFNEIVLPTLPPLTSNHLTKRNSPALTHTNTLIHTTTHYHHSGKYARDIFLPLLLDKSQTVHKPSCRHHLRNGPVAHQQIALSIHMSLTPDS